MRPVPAVSPFVRRLTVISLLLSVLLTFSPVSFAAKVSLNINKTDIAEVMDMLSRRHRVNILLASEVTGTVSANLYDVEVSDAIQMIAGAAGYNVEQRAGGFYIVPRADNGKYYASGLTRLKTFRIQYSEPTLIQKILEKYLSHYGKITALPQRKLLVIEDQPEFLGRIETLLHELDREPRQILIEARILEVTLRDSEAFGIDWRTLLSGNRGTIGTVGLAPGSEGFVADFLNADLDIFLNALQTSGRLHTLSTPKILTLEDQEARTIIGDRQGFKVTTTINQITTESIEFLKSGVILKVTPSVDESGRIMMDIHPEVSSGTVSLQGIPSQTTTEVTTKMLVHSGETVFIGGLIKHSEENNKKGVPGLSRIPVLGTLFTQNTSSFTKTETIVLITPHVIDEENRHLTLVNPAQTRPLDNLSREYLSSGQPFQNSAPVDNATSGAPQKPPTDVFDDIYGANALYMDH
ncbi:MAG: secretin N-terminal domain-containing protein [Pontibacterium sp.]